ncbi:hypothetical protein HK098_008229 [Nowakowskiella sp. JEL0407]|nr:hypothetical protein HK098_008229 [Nowakowskiella sp. JEL0407]
MVKRSASATTESSSKKQNVSGTSASAKSTAKNGSTTTPAKFDIVDASHKAQKSISKFYLDSFSPSAKANYTPEYITKFAEFMTEDSRGTVFWGETTTTRQQWIDNTIKMMEHAPLSPDARIEVLHHNIIFSDDEYCGLEVKDTYHMDKTGDFYLTCYAFMIFKKDPEGPHGVRCVYYQETKDDKLSKFPEFPESPADQLVTSSKKVVDELIKFYLEFHHPATRGKYTKEFITENFQKFSEDCKFTAFWGGRANSRAELIELMVGCFDPEVPLYPNATAEVLSSNVVFKTADKCGLEYKLQFNIDEKKVLVGLGMHVFVKDADGPEGVRCILFQETKDDAKSVGF